MMQYVEQSVVVENIEEPTEKNKIKLANIDYYY